MFWRCLLLATPEYQFLRRQALKSKRCPYGRRLIVRRISTIVLFAQKGKKKKKDKEGNLVFR